MGMCTSQLKTNHTNHSFSALNSEETRLMQTLDTLFKNWGILNGAFSMTMPLLLPVKDLALLDVYYNFPQQALLVSSLNLNQFTHDPIQSEITQIRSDILEPVELGIPSAACYAVYLHYKGQAIPRSGILITIKGQCCRKETHYDYLRRLLGFHMREVVALGSQSFTEAHLTQFSEKIMTFAALIGLPLRKEVATDLFYEPQNSVGQTRPFHYASPVKYEFLFEDVAIASINSHGTFFGERCQITLANSSKPIFTSCVAFGLERWLFALYRQYGNWHDPIEMIESLGWAA
ncbi:MAG: hypothetical protein A3F46_10760 [Legionellales bacterium RIFCSPHIGHO2_12_FULL_42_9]|nr:MAG: hypothetical protein A3F46_10760 [Legionellales bacterium RIFCSPHIGHO2_12_FULL_42_9]